MRTAHVHAAKLTPEQTELAEFDGLWARACRDVWNAALDERLGALDAARGRTMPKGWWPSYASQCRGLAQAKAVAPWLKEAPSHVLQQVLRDLDAAWVAWMFERRTGKPRFRALKRAARNWWAPSYRFPDRNQFTIRRTSKRWGEAKLPKIGVVRFRWDRTIPDGAAVTNVTLKRDRVGDWSVAVALDVPDVAAIHLHPETAVGVDVGVVALAVTSEGEVFDAMSSRPLASGLTCSPMVNERGCVASSAARHARSATAPTRRAPAAKSRSSSAGRPGGARIWRTRSRTISPQNMRPSRWKTSKSVR